MRVAGSRIVVMTLLELSLDQGSADCSDINIHFQYIPQYLALCGHAHIRFKIPRLLRSLQRLVESQAHLTLSVLLLLAC